MRTYIEEIYTPYGMDEVKLRVNRWFAGDGKKYKIQKQTSNEILLKRGMTMNPDIYFQLTIGEDTVRFECWVKGFTKDPISSAAVWGAISRRTGWNDFQNLKAILIDGVIPGSL